MKLKDKKNILNMTFDNMNMSEGRSEEIMKELINYNIKLESREEKENMREKKISVGENLHEISPKNNKNGRWQYAIGIICVLAVAALGFFIWNNAAIKDSGNKIVPGFNVQNEETTANEASADRNTDSANQTLDKDIVFFVETGKNEELTAIVIPSPSSKEPMYEIEHGNINMKLKKDYNYNIYSKETDKGLEMLAVGIRKEGDKYTYVYSKQLSTTGDDSMAETVKIPEDATAETGKLPDNVDISLEFPSFTIVSFDAGEKYIGEREELIEELSLFYNTVNELIDGREPDGSYKQNDIEGELGKGVFEYEPLEKAEASYITCGVKDPIDSRLELYFMYIDGEIWEE